MLIGYVAHAVFDRLQLSTMIDEGNPFPIREGDSQCLGQWASSREDSAIAHREFFLPVLPLSY